ncbi:hypothetical protein FS749_012081 [Ceratobasidium sp. UAMH 11750]|nr:hypothetical protein FS749_012081 [Ceratobasidium sp. UAMH 11750]
MADKRYDILVIGATGYTGRIVVEYLSTRKAALSLRVALGGRTLSTVQKLAEGHDNCEAVYVDVSDEDSVLAAVEKSRVVLSLAGPWWTHGSTVVRACARSGVHYVDITGETHWVAKIIEEYDFLAHKTGACIIPGAGFDSIPSDLAVYLSTRTLEKHTSGSGPLSIKSTGAHRWKIFGLSGGSRATILSSLEEVPPEKRRAGGGWGLSPISGPPGFSWRPKFLYILPHIRPTVHGGFFIMGPVNEPIVRRSWGLRERQRREQAIKAGVSPFPAPTFSYEEFMVAANPLRAIFRTLVLILGSIALAVFPLARWVLRKTMPARGEGPPRETWEKGWFELTNVAEAEGVVVKSVVKGDGDPAYYLTAWMVAECAILLLDESNLTSLGREGGILTATTAFGDRLAPALEATGKFETSSEVLVQEESRKTR